MTPARSVCTYTNYYYDYNGCGGEEVRQSFAALRMLPHNIRVTISRVCYSAIDTRHRLHTDASSLVPIRLDGFLINTWLVTYYYKDLKRLHILYCIYGTQKDNNIMFMYTYRFILSCVHHLLNTI